MVLGDVPASVLRGRGRAGRGHRQEGAQRRLGDAESYIFGYTNFIDGSARGMPVAGFYSMKSRATYAPIGPFITTKDEMQRPPQPAGPALEQ